MLYLYIAHPISVLHHSCVCLHVILPLGMIEDTAESTCRWSESRLGDRSLSQRKEAVGGTPRSDAVAVEVVVLCDRGPYNAVQA